MVARQCKLSFIIYLSITKGLCTLITHIDYFLQLYLMISIDEVTHRNIQVKTNKKKSTDNDIFWIQDIIILYDHNTYFLSSPVCQSCLIDLYKKLTEHFRPELFDDSDTVHQTLSNGLSYKLLYIKSDCMFSCTCNECSFSNA